MTKKSNVKNNLFLSLNFILFLNCPSFAGEKISLDKLLKEKEIQLICEKMENNIQNCTIEKNTVAVKQCDNIFTSETHAIECVNFFKEKFWEVIEEVHHYIIVADIIGWSSFLIFLVL